MTWSSLTVNKTWRNHILVWQHIYDNEETLYVYRQANLTQGDTDIVSDQSIRPMIEGAPGQRYYITLIDKRGTTRAIITDINQNYFPNKEVAMIAANHLLDIICEQHIELPPLEDGYPHPRFVVDFKKV